MTDQPEPLPTVPADERIKHCDRCRESVPAAEWKLHIAPNGRWYFRHEGELRGVVAWDPHHPDDRACGFTEPVQERV